VREASGALYAPGAERLFRFSMGLAMRELRGKVPAREVAGAVGAEVDAGARRAAGGTIAADAGSGR
jgi:hypothetical protein